MGKQRNDNCLPHARKDLAHGKSQRTEIEKVSYHVCIFSFFGLSYFILLKQQSENNLT